MEIRNDIIAKIVYPNNSPLIPKKIHFSFIV